MKAFEAMEVYYLKVCVMDVLPCQTGRTDQSVCLSTYTEQCTWSGTVGPSRSLVHKRVFLVHSTHRRACSRRLSIWYCRCSSYEVTSRISIRSLSSRSSSSIRSLAGESVCMTPDWPGRVKNCPFCVYQEIVPPFLPSKTPGNH